jgi:hypothetical protein
MQLITPRRGYKENIYVKNLPDAISNLAQEQDVLQYTQSDEDTE